MARSRRFASIAQFRCVTALVFAWLSILGCKSTAVRMAPTRSPHFEAVAANLQLGGTVYAYADIEGDAKRATEFLLSMLRRAGATRNATSAPEATRIVQALGLSEVDAIGMSSYANGDLYHNRSFVSRSGPKKGLLALFGNEPKPFGLRALATADTDMVWEQQLDLSALVDIARALGVLGVGPSPAALDQGLAKNLPGLDITVGNLLNRPNVTLGVIVDVDEKRVLRMPGDSFWFPLTEFLVQADGFGDVMAAVQRRASFDPFLRTERREGLLLVGTSIRLPPPWNAYQPVLIQDLDTRQVYFASSPQFFDRARRSEAHITETESYQTAFDQLPETGNGMLFLSRRLTREMHGAVDRWINETGVSAGTTLARLFLPDAGLPLGWVVANRPDGVLFTSNSGSSHKSSLLTLGYLGALPLALLLSGSRQPASAPPDPTLPFQ